MSSFNITLETPVLSPKDREQIWFFLFLAEICSFFHYLGNNFDKKQMFLTCCRNSSALPAMVPVSGSIFGRRVDVSLKAGSLSEYSSQTAERIRDSFFQACSITALLYVFFSPHWWLWWNCIADAVQFSWVAHGGESWFHCPTLSPRILTQ